ncbi:MAG: SH3 domain-containing protein [Caldilineaceae bacterium]
MKWLHVSAKKVTKWRRQRNITLACPEVEEDSIMAMAHKVLRLWLWCSGAMLFLLAILAHTPVWGQTSTPTPNVSTVPRPEVILTPTPPAVAPIVTATTAPSAAEPTVDVNRPNNGAPSSGSDQPAAGNAAAPAAHPSSVHTATNSNSLPATAPLFGTVNAVLLNLRQAPSTAAPILDQLLQGAVVTLLGRDQAQQWWYVCCGVATQLPGWVDTRYLTLSVPAEMLATLPVTDGAANLAGTSALTPTTSILAPVTSPLQLTLTPSRSLIWQGQRLVIAVVVTNPGDQPAVNVQLRDDLPAGLMLQSITVTDYGQWRQAGEARTGPTFWLSWPQIAAGAQVHATVTLTVAPDAANGLLLDNIAILTAQDHADILAGFTLVMPPRTLPHFR